MGNSQSEDTFHHINVHICGYVKKFNKSISELFPELKGSKERLYKLELNDLPSKEIIQWNSFIENGKITEELIDKIFDKIETQSTEKKIEKHCIICFYSKKSDEKIIVDKFNIFQEKNESITPFIILAKCIKEENDNEEEEYENFKKLKFLNYLTVTEKNYISNDKLNDKISNDIRSKLFQIDSYFNERGNVFIHYIFDNMENSKNPIDFTYNIMVFGHPGSGKSRFINLSVGEKVSR